MNRKILRVKSITKSKRFVQQRERNRTKPCSNSAAKFFNLLQSLRTLALIWPQEFHKKNSPFHQKLYEVALPFLNERSVTATLGACWKTSSLPWLLLCSFPIEVLFTCDTLSSLSCPSLTLSCVRFSLNLY